MSTSFPTEDEEEPLAVTKHRGNEKIYIPDMYYIRILGEHTASVLSRLQRLFLSSPYNTARPDGPGTAESVNVLPQQSSRKISSVEPKLLKVRILTWNMHDSLPKVVLIPCLSYSNH